ncbi:MAG: alpha/beta fold hydrolase [Synechococcus sp.]|nr:alpha/beta fold hydrolase [Synechococcus sp.]
MAASRGSQQPLVLVHGLWDTPQLFRQLVTSLAGQRAPLLIPHLPHGLGQVPLGRLAEALDKKIQAAFGPDASVDLLGFSMGGLVARAWIENLGGHRRTRRFVCVGSPQRGTLMAQPVPRGLLAGIADMKIGSSFLRQLEASQRLHPSRLGGVDCRSFFCPLDLLVVPSWRGVLPVGPIQALPALTHPGLVSEPRSVAALCAVLLEP